MKKRNMRILAALVSAVLLAGFAFGFAYAVDIDYSGELDPETNQPVSSSASTSPNRVILSPTMYYDYDSHDYVFPVTNSLTEIHANVPDGIVTTNSVSVNAGGDSSVIVFCNGNEITGATDNLRTVGDYVVTYRSGGTSQQIFSFTIVGPRTSAIHSYSVPDGFYITQAVYEGEQNILTNRYTVDMEEEGDYYVEYECGATGFRFTLSTTIDRTPPALTFTGRIDSQQRVHSALKFEGLENDDTIYLLQDAVQVEPRLNGDGTGEIVDSGNYVMRVYDAAGNVKEYIFTIMVYLNVGAWFFILILVAVIVAIFVYVILKRKRLKIG